MSHNPIRPWRDIDRRESRQIFVGDVPVGGGAPISRIVSMLKQGSGVVTTRNHVHYVVTEYGVANLYAKTIKQRARALIEIAHPDFREALEQDPRSSDPTPAEDWITLGIQRLPDHPFAAKVIFEEAFQLIVFSCTLRGKIRP